MWPGVADLSHSLQGRGHWNTAARTVSIRGWGGWGMESPPVRGGKAHRCACPQESQVTHCLHAKHPGTKCLGTLLQGSLFQSASSSHALL